MSEARNTLSLGDAHREIVLKEESSIAVLSDKARDLDRIFGEKHLWFPQCRTQLQLESKQKSKRRPPYAVSAEHSSKASEWHVDFGDLTAPGQAAARTALFLYENKQTGKVNGGNPLRVNDAQATTLNLGWHGKYQAGLDPSNERAQLMSFYDKTAGVNLTWSMGTEVFTLPAMLGELQDRRRRLYGEVADPLAVTAMLGSHVALGEFTDVWNDAMAQRTAVQGARYLFDSGIFIPQPPLESQF